MASNKKLKLTLVRSTAGKLPSHKATITSLGLRRLSHSVQVIDTAAMRGMIDKVAYLLKIEEVK